MTIDRITVSAERCFNHPYENYSNLRPALEMSASLADGEDPDQALRALQAKAETMIEQHKRTLLDQIEKLQRSTQIVEELRQMESGIKKAQERYAELQKEKADLGETKFTLLGPGDDEEGS